MLDTANHNLTFLQPENVQALQNFSNFNLKIYTDTINNLQNQIQALQHQQEYAEQDLNVKYKQINDVRTNQKIRINKDAKDETLKEITQIISKIDHKGIVIHITQVHGTKFKRSWVVLLIMICFLMNQEISLKGLKKYLRAFRMNRNTLKLNCLIFEWMIRI